MDQDTDKIVEVVKSHPQWKQIEKSIRQRETLCLAEMRDERDLYTMCKRAGELFAYAWILGKVPEHIAQQQLEEQERSK